MPVRIQQHIHFSLINPLKNILTAKIKSPSQQISLQQCKDRKKIKKEKIQAVDLAPRQFLKLGVCVFRVPFIFALFFYKMWNVKMCRT